MIKRDVVIMVCLHYAHVPLLQPVRGRLHWSSLRCHPAGRWVAERCRWQV